VKHILIAGAFAASLALGGCATPGGGGGGGIDICGGPVANIMDVAKCAQRIAVNACAFSADVASLVELVPVYGNDANALAAGICAAVNSVPKLSARRKAGAGATVNVRGVGVTGHFVR
jgi:hypothetical protein